MKNPLNKRKTVDGIMSAFTKTITDLETVADSNEVDVIDMQAEKQELDRKILESSAEASRARGIVANLESLVRPTSDEA